MRAIRLLMTGLVVGTVLVAGSFFTTLATLPTPPSFIGPAVIVGGSLFTACACAIGLMQIWSDQ